MGLPGVAPKSVEVLDPNKPPAVDVVTGFAPKSPPAGAAADAVLAAPNRDAVGAAAVVVGLP